MLSLYKNDFLSAIKGENPNVSTLNYEGVIQMLTNETFMIVSESDFDISFAGGITVELVDCNNNVITNIDSNFFYEGFIDNNGIAQIAYEFGMIGTDYWTRPLHLKITDTINGNEFYSNSFLVSDYKSDLTSRFDYYKDNYMQSVRLAGMYEQTTANKQDYKQYTQFDGKQVNYRNITTYLRKVLIDKVDFNVCDKLHEIINCPIVYFNNQRVTISDYKVGERVGDTNFISGGEFLVNKSGQTYTFVYQLFVGFILVDRLPLNESIYTETAFSSSILANGLELEFNRVVSWSETISVDIYKDNILLLTVTNLSFFYITDTRIGIDISAGTFTNGAYSIVIAPNQIYSGLEYFNGFAFNEWTFTIADGEYSNTDYNTEFLTN